MSHFPDYEDEPTFISRKELRRDKYKQQGDNDVRPSQTRPQKSNSPEKIRLTDALLKKLRKELQTGGGD